MDSIHNKQMSKCLFLFPAFFLLSLNAHLQTFEFILHSTLPYELNWLVQFSVFPQQPSHQLFSAHSHSYGPTLSLVTLLLMRMRACCLASKFVDAGLSRFFSCNGHISFALGLKSLRDLIAFYIKLQLVIFSELAVNFIFAFICFLHPSPFTFIHIYQDYVIKLPRPERQDTL